MDQLHAQTPAFSPVYLPGRPEFASVTWCWSGSTLLHTVRGRGWRVLCCLGQRGEASQPPVRRVPVSTDNVTGIPGGTGGQDTPPLPAPAGPPLRALPELDQGAGTSEAGAHGWGALAPAWKVGKAGEKK